MIKALLSLLFLFILNEVSYSQSLDFYLEKGFQNSPLLKDYQNQISSATLDSIIIVSAQRPSLNFNIALTYAPTFNNGRNGYDEVITNDGTYSTTLGVQQAIFNGKLLANKFETIHIQQKSIANTKKLSTNDLKRVITNQYLIVLGDYDQLSFNQEFLKLMLEEKDIMKNMVAHGVYKQTDYLSLLIETQSQEILINQLKSQFTIDNHLINQLCGINDTSQHQYMLPSIAKLDKSDPSLSPLFIQYKLDSLKIENDKSAVNLNYHPKISWMADAGFLSSTIPGFYQHFGLSVGLSVSIPIYDGHQRKYNYQKLALSESTRSNYESFYKTQYNQQIIQLNSNISSNQIVINQLKTQLKSAEELITLSKLQLNAGNMPITDFINAAKNYITINMNLTQAQIKELQFITELNYLMQ